MSVLPAPQAEPEPSVRAALWQRVVRHPHALAAVTTCTRCASCRTRCRTAGRRRPRSRRLRWVTTWAWQWSQLARRARLYIAWVRWLAVGTLAGSAGFWLVNCRYFSAETHSPLGFGDLTPVRPICLLAGAEALDGLLLIGWTAFYTCVAMERSWTQNDLPV